MRFVLCVEGNSVDELFAAGPKDLKNHLLPELLGIKSEDIKDCWFEEVEGNPIEDESYILKTHPDNIYNNRKESK